MCIKVIHHKNDLLGIRFYIIYQISYLFCPINSGTSFFNSMQDTSCMRLYQITPPLKGTGFAGPL